MKTKSKKRPVARRVIPKPPKTVTGTLVKLTGDMYGSDVTIKGAKPAAIAAKINNALKTGKLIELGGQWIAPSAVTAVRPHKWQDYNR